MFDLYFAGIPTSEICQLITDKILGANRLVSYLQKKQINDMFQRRNKMFDLYFAGTQANECEEKLLEKNCNRLASQLNDKKLLQFWCKKNEEGKVGGKIFIDSGAYTAHTQGTSINCDDYIEYLNSIDKDIDLFAQLDTIPGEFRKSRTIQQVLAAPASSWENYNYMRSRVYSPDKLLPIYHQGENESWLKLMLETTYDGKHIPYIGISPSNDVSVSEKLPWIIKCFKIIKESSNPNVKTHAFGMTSLKVLEKYPFTSADSTTWIMVGANGGILTKFGVLLVSKNQINDAHNIRNLPSKMYQQVKNYIESYGSSIEKLQDDYKERMIFNILYLKDWADNYVYKPQQIYNKNIFLNLNKDKIGE